MTIVATPTTEENTVKTTAKPRKPKSAKKTPKAPKAPKAAKEPKAPRKPRANKPKQEKPARYEAQTLEREYKGKTYYVHLAADGTCEAGGKGYHSLTALAEEITGCKERGTRISGPAFFRLGQPAKAPRPKK